MARNIMLGKLAPSFRTILGNSEGPLMELFNQFTERSEKPRSRPGRDRRYEKRPGRRRTRTAAFRRVTPEVAST